MMRLIFLLFFLSFPLFALSNNFKVVIDSFSTKEDARKAYLRYQNDPQSIISQYKNEKEFILHFRKSGGRYIIAAEPFSSRQDAEAVVQKIISTYPNASVSQGVANDIEFLLMQHRNALKQQSSFSEVPKSTLPPSVTPVTPVLPSPTVDSSKVSFSFWIIGILILLTTLYIFWREQSYKKLTHRYNELFDEKESIQKAIQAKNDFIAMMSHEIRAPINAVMGISHLVLESHLSVTQRSQITKIKASASLLLNLINDILDHSKMEAGKVTIEQIPFDLNALLDDISNIISHKANEKKLELIFDLDSTVPNKLIGDPLRLLQVLVNLLNNAVKFTESGNIVLRARGQHISRLNLKIHFEVIDTGIGMNHEQIDRLFHSYAQADETISRRYGGTGLGLSICKNLVALMGGTIQVQSKLNEGSTFSFDIKLHSDLDFEKRRYRLPTTELMSKNALILDENTHSASVLQRGLEYFHYEVKPVVDSLDAIALLQKYTFDIVFIDTKMSLCGEFKKELQNRIKNDELKLVWMGEDLKKRGGFILTKPYNQLDIFNAILSIYGYMDQNGKHHNNTKKLKESLKKFAGETLLLAEDNEINRSIISGLLAGTDIAIITAKTGKEAVEAVQLNPAISVILMDIQMPIMDGFEATLIIRQDPAKEIIPIIAVTGNSLESDIQNIHNAGMNGHITKPIDVNTFYTTLYYAFEKSLTHAKRPNSSLNIA
ncbi:MAG: ATP-binding protein [Sulfuricurvum sp.]|uniref:ATP-binding protein n=1 Tax=Sulfuricurvum sp. TaxID=2025608 RepID=UPI00260F8BDF|nr:ATP-binding protein [Sulfuricurvum sp.]MDD5159248.1 ATP-binding protein [Sulfuricurvum sp.]